MMQATGLMRVASRASRRGANGQIVFLSFLLFAGSALILATIQVASFTTVFLLGFVSVGGLALCRGTQAKLKDPNLKILGYFWLIKLGVTLFLLYVGWMPQLDPSSVSWGYDPQRYYIQAKELIDNHWSTGFINLNYVGILYYYGGIFYVLGHNPIIPALINAFVTLMASLYLVKVGYEIKGQRSSGDWKLAFALLLPELLWYDVMTARETLMAALLLYAVLTVGRYLAQTASISLANLSFKVSLSVFAIAAVRTSMILPVFASILVMIMFVMPKHRSQILQRVILAGAAAVTFIVGLGIAGYLGGYDFDLGNAIHLTISAKDNIASSGDMQWSENSVGLLLMPEGLFQAIIFLPLRMVLYLVAPLPNIWVPVSDLFAGSWGAWQFLFTLLSSVINVLTMPYALASFDQSIKMRKESTAPLIFHISYWVTFMAIAGGNLIIHERYRVMATLLLWGCAWLGARTCSKYQVVRASLVWYGLLTLGAIFYFCYKTSK
jgi:hypothetical protein